VNVGSAHFWPSPTIWAGLDLTLKRRKKSVRLSLIFNIYIFIIIYIIIFKKTKKIQKISKIL